MDIIAVFQRTLLLLGLVHLEEDRKLDDVNRSCIGGDLRCGGGDVAMVASLISRVRNSRGLRVAEFFVAGKCREKVKLKIKKMRYLRTYLLYL